MPRTARIAAGVLGSALLLTACNTPDQPPGGEGSWTDEPTDSQLAALAKDTAADSEQFYFVMTDRFADGDASNNTGGLQGDSLTTGYDPTKRMFYQGGDLAAREEQGPFSVHAAIHSDHVARDPLPNAPPFRERESQQGRGQQPPPPERGRIKVGVNRPLTLPNATLARRAPPLSPFQGARVSP